MNREWRRIRDRNAAQKSGPFYLRFWGVAGMVFVMRPGMRMAARLVSLGRQPLRFRKRARVNYDYAGPLCWSTRGIPETIRRNFQSGCLKVQLRTVLRSSLWCNGPLAFNGSGGPDIHIQESHRPDRNTGRRKGTGESGLGPIEARGGFEAGTGGLLAQGCGNFAEGLAGKAWAGEGRVRRTSYSCSNVGLGGACVRLEQQSGGREVGMVAIPCCSLAVAT